MENLLFYFCLAMVDAALATPIACLLGKIFYIPLLRKKLLQKAIEDGHVVTATLIKQQSGLASTSSDVLYSSAKMYGKYKYEYQGKTYYYHGTATNDLPDEITLYFETKPSRACSSLELGNKESRWRTYYWLLVAVFFICGLLGFFDEFIVAG